MLRWFRNMWNLNLSRIENFSAEHLYIVLFETNINCIFLLKTPNFPCAASIYCPFWNHYKLIFSFLKLHGFENVSLNTLSSPYVLKTKSVTLCYIAIIAITMFKVPLARLKPPLLWYWAGSSTNEVLGQWNVILKPIVILSRTYGKRNQLQA